MEKFFYSILPLVWLLAAALVSLILYRTSRALVRADTIGGLPVKEVRITGSIAIFVIVYVLLWQTTQNMAALDRELDQVPLSRSSFEEAARLTDRIEAGAVRLAGCAATPMPLSDCPVDVGQMHEDAEGLKRLMSSAAADPP